MLCRNTSGILGVTLHTKFNLLLNVRRPGFLIAAIICLSLANLSVYSQVTIRGSVYDMTKTRPLEGVSVMSTSGKGTTTNSAGRYAIQVKETDSIYFSYLNKPTMKFPVSTLSHFNDFDISLHVPSNILPEVRIMAPSYRLDSLQNRKDYAKVFNYNKPGIGITSGGPAGAGLDLDQFISMFNFRKKRSMVGFQRRLIEEEQDKYVDHRFNRIIVKEITQLTGSQLDQFMKLFRPTYEFTELTNDYDFYDYIKRSYLQYKAVFLPKE